jgi:hypothetical protein
MQGDPSCTWASYLLPQLRRFPQDGKPIHFRKFLGHGVEGCVARVKFGEDQDTAFALKTVCPVNPLADLGRENNVSHSFSTRQRHKTPRVSGP